MLLDYLTRVAEMSQGETEARWLGRIQVVVTTHSPLLASHTNALNIVVLHRRQLTAAIDSRTGDNEVTSPSSPIPVAYTSTAITVHELAVPSSDEARINRYVEACMR